MEPETEQPPRPPAPGGRGRHVVNWILAAVAILLAAVCFFARKKDEAPAAAPAPPVPGAPAARVERADMVRTVVIPAEFRPYVVVELRAKVSGYLDEINVDFGDGVKSNQLLATIDVPELQDQLNNALAAEQQAEANYTNAHLIHERINGVNQAHPNLVAQQDVDTATANESTAQAAIAAAKAEVGRCQALVSYTRITAPFDGVVTRRYVDPGALVEAGTSSENTQPLLEISDNYHLRLDFPVAQQDVGFIHVGDTIQGTVQSFNGLAITGKITRATWMVNADTRTMTTEVEAPNPDLKLVPGMYVDVSIPVERHTRALAVPSAALPAGETSSVYVIDGEGVIEDRPVKPGIETPDTDEILSGLEEGEIVLTGSRASFRPGQKVQPDLAPQ